jgi:hypothetical protein
MQEKMSGCSNAGDCEKMLVQYKQINYEPPFRFKELQTKAKSPSKELYAKTSTEF